MRKGKITCGLLEDWDFEVVDSFAPDAEVIAGLDAQRVDVLLIDGLQEYRIDTPVLLESWNGAVLYHDAISTRTSQLLGRHDSLARTMG